MRNKFLIFNKVLILSLVSQVGNQTATVVALACLKEQDLTKDVNQLAIRDIGGMEVLVNLLEVKDFKCKLGALYVLRAISSNIDCSRAITDLGGVVSLCEILDLAVSDLQLCAAQTIANVCRLRRARKIVRKAGGIPKLVSVNSKDRVSSNTPGLFGIPAFFF